MNQKFRTKLFNLVALALVLSLAMPWSAFAETVISQIVSVGASGNHIAYTAGAQGIAVKFWIENTGQSQCDPAVTNPAVIKLRATKGGGTTGDSTSRVYAKVSTAAANQAPVALSTFGLSFNTCGNSTTNTQTVIFSTDRTLTTAAYKIDIASVTDSDARNEYSIGSANFFLDVSGPDTDGDSFIDSNDPDDDNDGVADAQDAFPLDASESADTDGDKIGNNADADDDNDGVVDTSDNCSLVANSNQLNTDGDSQGNACDLDDDNDGVADVRDAFPLDAAESVDTDGDKIGNNTDADDDNDGVADVQDAFPLNAAESVDTDGDKIGNNTDDDDDNDGVTDNQDNCQLVANRDQADNDSDGVGNVCDETPNGNDTTTPEITLDISGTQGQNGWYTSNVSIDWTVEDPESGIFSATGCTDLVIQNDTAGTTLTCKATSVGGTSEKSVTIKRDGTAPTVTYDSRTAANGAGWNNDNVTVTWSCADSLSGAVTTSVSETIGTEGRDQSIIGTCYDLAGNDADDTQGNIDIDVTTPTITYDSRTAANGAGWNNGNVTVTWSCADSLSGPVATSVSETVSTEAANQSVTGYCADLAGNGASNEQSGINIDKSAPSLNVKGAADGAVFNICDARPVSPTYQPVDALSGLDGTENSSWTKPTTTSGAGAYTYKAWATDLAGNASSETRGYKVTYGGVVSGALQPINGGSTEALTDDNSRFKLGSTVPVKFTLMCGTTPVSNAVAKLNIKQADGTPDPGIDEAVSTAASTTGNLFRWDGTQYIFNLSTKTGYTNPNGTTISAFTAGTWTLSIMLDDNTYRSVNIQLVK